MYNIFYFYFQDQGDYKCIAENPAGRSEVTYKLWMPVKDPSQPDPDNQALLSKVIYPVITMHGLTSRNIYNLKCNSFKENILLFELKFRSKGVFI